jgi:hypothetical protein
MGRRVVLARKGRRSNRRASSDGVAIPVVDTVTRASTSSAVMPAWARQSSAASVNRSTACSRYRAFFSAQPRGLENQSSGMQE